MTLWIIGMLFTYGYVLDAARKESADKSAAFFFMVLIFWPVILGLEISKK
jgi:hypothetical protein